jgi:rubrerythrin
MAYALPCERVEAKKMNHQIENLLYEALETELGGVQVYTAALTCAQNEELKEEWQEYLDQTRKHVEILRALLTELGMDVEKETPGRRIVRHHGQSLVAAMKMAQNGPDPAAAQLVAAECVILAETKDHQNWELIGELAKKLKGEWKRALSGAHAQVEQQEDEHLYHTQGWARELWLESLGLPAVLPPPEEKKDVKTAIGAARAKQSRGEMLKGGRGHSRQPRT